MAREVVKNVVIKGKAQTGAIKKSLKEIQSETSKVGKAANRTKAQMDKLAGGMDKASTKSAKLGDSLKSVKGLLAAGGYTAAVVGAVRAVDQLADRAFKLGNVYGNLPFPIDKAKTSTMGFVESSKLAELAIQANRLGIAKSEKDFAKFAAQAVKLGVSVGKGPVESIEEWTVAVGRGSSAIADNFGIQVKAVEAQEAYAKAHDMTVSAMTESQKKLAMQEALVKKATEMTEGVTISTHSLSAAWKKGTVAAIEYADKGLLAIDQRMGSIIGAQATYLERAAEIAKMAKDQATFKQYGVPERDMLDSGQQEFSFGGGETFGSLTIASDFSRAAMDSDRRIGVKAGKKKRGSGKKKKTEDEKLMELMEKAKMTGSMDALDELAASWAAEEEAARSHEISMMEIKLDGKLRSIEEQRAAGVDPMSLIAQEEEARNSLLQKELEFAEQIEDINERRIEVANLENQIDANHHDAKLKRMAEEARAREADLKDRKDSMMAVNQAMMEAANTANVAAELGLIGEKRAAGISVWAGGVRLAWRSAELGAEAIGNIASQNYVKGGAQLAASAALAAQAGAHFGKAATLGGGGGGLGIGRTVGVSLLPGGGTVGSSQGVGGGTGGTGSGGSADRPGIPTSRPGDVPPPSPANGPPPSGGNTYVFNGGLWAHSREELGLELRKLENEASQRFGT